MRKKIILIMFAVIVFMSCKSTSKHELTAESFTKITISEIPEYKGAKFSDLFDSIKVVRLETSAECLIGRIDKILYHKDKIFIMDQVISKSVYMFDSTGKFITKIGYTGKGPGEYDEPNDIAIDRYFDRILILNNAGRNLLSYNLTGEFAGAIKLDFHIKSFSIVDEDTYALYLDRNTGDRVPPGMEGKNLVLINERGKVLNEFFEFERLSKGSFSFFCSHGERVLVSPGYSNNIYSIRKEACKLEYNIDFGPHTIPDDFFNDSEYKFQDRLKASRYACLIYYFETDDYLVFSFSCQSIVYNSYYSKKTGKLFFANLFLNDLFSFISGVGIAAVADGNTIISYFEPYSIGQLKNMYNKSNMDGKAFKNELLKPFKTDGLLSGNMAIYKDMVESIDYNPTVEEVEFINSISPTDNPVLIFHYLKHQ